MVAGLGSLPKSRCSAPACPPLQSSGSPAEANMEWVSSKQLMIALGATPSDWLPQSEELSKAADAVCRRAHDGLLRARAKAFFKNGEALGECDLPKEFWWREGDSYGFWARWGIGDFLTNDPDARDAWRPWKAYGVEW